MQLLVVLKLKYVSIAVVALLLQCCHLRARRLFSERLKHLEASPDAIIGDILSSLFVKRLG